MSEKTIYDCERAKFDGFGTYKLPIEERVNEIMEATKKEYPNIDNYYFFHGKKEEGVDEEVHLRSSMEGNNMEVEQGKGIDLAEDNFDLDQMR